MRAAWDQRYTPREWSRIDEWGGQVKPEPLDLDEKL